MYIWITILTQEKEIEVHTIGTEQVICIWKVTLFFSTAMHKKEKVAYEGLFAHSNRAIPRLMEWS